MTSPDAQKEIAEGLRINHLSAAEQERIIGMFMENVASRLTEAVWERFSDEQKEAADVALNGATPEEVLAYFQKELPDLPQLVEQISRELAEDFRQRSAAMQAQG